MKNQQSEEFSRFGDFIKKMFYPNIAPRLSTKVLIESQIFWMTPGTVLGFGSGLLVVVAPTVLLS